MSRFLVVALALVGIPCANADDWPQWLGPQRDGEWREMKVGAARVQGNTLVAQLDGVGTREAAAAYRGFEIGVPRKALPAASSGEFYRADLIGLKVVNRQHEELGRVERIVEIEFDAGEQAMFQKSVAAVRTLVDACKGINPGFAA